MIRNAAIVFGLAAAAVFAAKPAATTATTSAEPVTVNVVDQNGQQIEANVIAVVSDDPASSAAANGNGIAVYKTVTATATKDGDTAPQVRVVTRVAHAGDPNRGWLGVALGEVADDQTAGVSVLNVVKGSPAEAAGLQEKDIITSINGAAMSKVADVAGKIGELGAGTNVTLNIERDGKAMTLSAQLAKPQDGNVEWAYSPSDVIVKSFTSTDPHIIKIDPSGKVLMFNGANGAAGAIAPLMGDNNVSVQVTVDNGVRTTKISSNDDGQITEVSQNGDEAIHVRHYAEGHEDEATEADYDTAEDLAAADPDAAALYKRQTGGVWIQKAGDEDFSFNFGTAAPGDAEWMSDLHERIAEALKAAGVSIDDAHGALAHTFNLPAGAGAGHMFIARAATRSFKVQPNGQIEVTVRDGDSEVTTVYKNEADLKARNAEAYEKFQSVQQTKVQD